jgi:predicted nucleic acid-binding protein
MICIDSNVWIYYLDATTPEHEHVRGPVREALGERTIFMNAVVPLEVTHHLTKRQQGGEPFVERFLGLETVTVEPLGVEMVQRAHELLHEYPHVGIGGRDASLVAAMERRGVDELWTHDTGLKRLEERLEWLTVVDPIEC